MKRLLTLLLAVMLVVSLFAGCGNNNAGGDTGTQATPDSSTPAGNTADDGAGDAGDVQQEDSPYNLPAGKYEVDENGVPTEQYVYELPLTTTDEVFTMWTSPILIDQLPDNGMADLPLQTELRDRTGVIIEYVEIAGAYPGAGPRNENFAVLLAADDLPDIVTNVDWYYPGPLAGAWDDGFFVNLYDYLEYMPCYWWYANSQPDDPSLLGHVLSQPETIYSFWCLEYEPVILNNGVTRGDWLDELGLTNDDIVTLDDWRELLTRYKNEIGVSNSFLLYNTLDAMNMFSCFDTRCIIDLAALCTPLVENGKVVLANTRQQDLDYLTTMNQWWNEGLIYQNWAAVIGNLNALDDITNSRVGIMGMVPSESVTYAASCVDPDCYYVPLRKPVKEEGQVLHCGDLRSWKSYGSWSVNTKCENIPLVVSYLDYAYSEEGIFLYNYGVEGISWEYNENGDVQLTDFMMNNESGFAQALMHYAMCELIDGGVNDRFRSYAYPGGEAVGAFHAYWAEEGKYNYDGSMEWPSSIALTSEQTEEAMEHGADMNTYIAENLLQFVDGSKALSEWDSYVAGLENLGMEGVRAVYQEAYDEYIAIYG